MSELIFMEKLLDLSADQAEGVEENSVVRNFRITANNGNQYNTNFNHLEFEGFKKQTGLNCYKKLKGDVS
ncbi:MAG: hypothetical protein PF692_05735 [Kiritimatiellae bacterium]|jgi:hypothetical protein|nr:hypothetical protein [Kiritimatiellia bacterium]